MKRRTTIELDEDLLNRAQKALGIKTTRGTVEQALRLAADAAEDAQRATTERQVSLLGRLGEMVEVEVLKSDEMWR